jgi:hypothetical protein
MAYGSATCFVGRIIFRDDNLGGLNWQDSCPVPAENELSVDGVETYFCSPHFVALNEQLYQLYDEAGLIDHGIVGGGPDAGDGVDKPGGTPDLHQGH